MRLHAERGDPARALGVYHECAAVWERELGVGPSAATRAAYAALLPRETTAAARRSPRPPRSWAAPPSGGSWWTCSGPPSRAAPSSCCSPARRASGRRVSSRSSARGARGKARSSPRRGATPPKARWCTARWRRGCGRVRCARGSRSSTPRAGPSSPACCPSCSSKRPTPRSPCRSRPTSTACGCSTRWPTPCSPRPPRGCWSSTTCSTSTARPAGSCTTSCAASPPPGCSSRRRPVARRSTATIPRRSCWPGCTRSTGAPRSSWAASTGRRPTRWRASSVARRVDAQRLYAETEGNPLFVVEALRLGPGAPVSKRVQTVLEARLAQLSAPARALAEVAATIGREFRVEVLAAAAGEADDVLLDGLDELWRRRILREQDAHAYRFSHDRLREVAALGVSPPRRRLLHLRIAPALEHAHAADPGPVSAQIARHYAEGGSASHAVTWYRRAAEAAQELHASDAAVDLLERAVHQVRTLPPLAKPRRCRAGAAERGARPARVDRGLRRARDRGAPARSAPAHHGAGRAGGAAAAALARDERAHRGGLPRHLAHRRAAAGRGRAPRRGRCSSSRAPTCWGWRRSGKPTSPPPASTWRRPSPATGPPTCRPTSSATARTRRSRASARLGNTLWFLGEPDAARRRPAPTLLPGPNGSRSRSAPASRCSSARCWPSTWTTSPACANSSRGWRRRSRSRRRSSCRPTRWSGYLAVCDGAADGRARRDRRRHPRGGSSEPGPRRARDPGPHPARRSRRGRGPATITRGGERPAHDGWCRSCVGGGGPSRRRRVPPGRPLRNAPGTPSGAP